jgi:hypothetical protein
MLDTVKNFVSDQIKNPASLLTAIKDQIKNPASILTAITSNGNKCPPMYRDEQYQPKDPKPEKVCDLDKKHPDYMKMSNESKSFFPQSIAIRRSGQPYITGIDYSNQMWEPNEFAPYGYLKPSIWRTPKIPYKGKPLIPDPNESENYTEKGVLCVPDNVAFDSQKYKDPNKDFMNPSELTSELQKLKKQIPCRHLPQFEGKDKSWVDFIKRLIEIYYPKKDKNTQRKYASIGNGAGKEVYVKGLGGKNPTPEYSKTLYEFEKAFDAKCVDGQCGEYKLGKVLGTSLNNYKIVEPGNKERMSYSILEYAKKQIREFINKKTSDLPSDKINDAVQTLTIKEEDFPEPLRGYPYPTMSLTKNLGKKYSTKKRSKGKKTRRSRSYNK